MPGATALGVTAGARECPDGWRTVDGRLHGMRGILTARLVLATPPEVKSFKINSLRDEKVGA